MIQPAAPALVSLPAAPPSPSGASGAGGGFTLSLAGFLDAGEAGETIPSDGPHPGDERQGDADDGSILPGDDVDTSTPDPALAWLAILMPVAPTPRPIAFVPQPQAAAPIGVVAISTEPMTNVVSPAPVSAAPASDPTRVLDPSLQGDGTPPILPAQRASTDMPAAISEHLPRPEVVAHSDLPLTVSPEPAGTAGLAAAASADPRSGLSPVPPSVLALIAAAKAIVLPSSPAANARPLPNGGLPGAALQTPIDDVPAPIVAPADRVPKPATASPLPTQLPDAAPLPAAISQALAEVLRPAATNDRPAVTIRRDDEPAVFQIAGIPAEARGVAVAAAGDTQNATLDLSQQRWTHAIIDRIERMRDGIDAADTRIRVAPDALGSIDISVRKDGDTLHVHFAAEQGATRAILQDAQPRLAEIAESRGMKLGQTGVGAGNGEAGRPPPQPRQSQPPRPAPVLARASEPANDRLA